MFDFVFTDQYAMFIGSVFFVVAVVASCTIKAVDVMRKHLWEEEEC